MPDDGQIRIGLAVDYSSVGPATQATASSVESLRDRVNAASKSMAEAQAAFGKAAALGNQQATTALRSYEEELNSAKSALASFAGSENAATESTVRETSALRSNISARMAASAELRVLEGNMMGSTRAAAALISTIPGLNALSQALFPAFGLAALAGAAYQAGESLAKAFDLGGERARAVRKDISDVNNEMNRSITSLDVQIDKLQQEQAKLEKKPFNGMKLVLDEAAEAAQNLATKLDSVIERETKAVAGMAASFPQKLLLGQTGTGYEQTMLQEHTKWLDQATNTQQELNESTSFGNSLQVRLNDLKKQQAESDARAQVGAATGSTVVETDYGNQIRAVQELLRFQQQEHTAIQKTMELNTQQATTQHAKDTHTTGDPNVQKMRDIETAFAELNTKLPEEAVAFWAKYNGTFKSGSTEYLHVLEQINKYTNEFSKGLQQSTKLQDAVKRMDDTKFVSTDSADEGILKFAKAVQEGAEDAQRSGERWERYNAEVAKGQEIQMQATTALREQHIAAQEASGVITKLSADHQLAAVHADEYASKLKTLNAELQRLEALRASLKTDPLTGQTPGASQADAQIQNTKNQIAQTTGQGAVTAAKDQSSITNDIAKPYLTAFNEIETSFMRMQSQMLIGHKTAAQAMRQEEQSLAMFAIEQTEKWLLHKLQAFLIEKLQKATTGATTTSMQAAADAAQAATTAAVNVAQASSYAAVAAAAGAAAVAGIPLVGPELAVTAAAALYAQGMSYAGLAAFEGGGIIPNTGIAMVHRGEAVIPQPLTRMLTDTAENGGNSSGGGHQFHSVYAPQISVLDSKGIESFTRRAGDHMGAQMMRQARKANQVMKA